MALAPLVGESLDLLGDRFASGGIEVDCQPPAEDAVTVMGCDGELQQVFTNLIVNAVDAMNETGGRLTVDLEASGALVTLRVQDSGPGIPPDKLEMIFQPFYSTKLNRGGTGLGLSISYEIVRRHGGDLRVVSRPGEGACFLVELPRQEGAPAHDGMNILIIDDEEVLQDILTVLIRKEGHTPLSATHGRGGAGRPGARGDRPRPPRPHAARHHGIEVLREIRSATPTCWSSSSPPSPRSRAPSRRCARGAFHYIPKPFKNEEVMLTVRKALEQRRLSRENRALQRAAPAALRLRRTSSARASRCSRSTT